MGLEKSKFSHETQEQEQQKQQQQSKNDLTILTYSQIRRICQQTNLIDKEVCRRHDVFLTIAKDGKMHRKTFIDVIQQIWPNGNTFNFANYLFDLFDLDRRSYMDSTRFIILTCQLKDGKSYLGYLFDMFDTERIGYLLENKVPSLCSAFVELVGGERQIAYLYRLVEQSEKKRLYREQFINLGQCCWSDDENGDGILLIEHPC